ncbi:MAG: hypothetical protein HOK82_03810 [Rhodospirillaceae bacterium]|jgi:hypothetical protein|nr:hypothetical protein [Rhodospirillaceae bacterium]
MSTQKQHMTSSRRRRAFPGTLLFCLRSMAFLALLAVFAAPASAAPKISGITVKANGTVDIRGSGFGKPCRKCAVIADYGGFLYALKTKSWRDKTIAAHLPDLGKKLDVRLTVQSKTGKSNAQRAKIKPVLRPKRLPRSAVRGTPSSGLLRFTFQSKDRKGGRGEQSHRVTSKAAACGKKTLVFHAAGLVLLEKRFAQARISRAPKSGCAACQPVKVSWRHEPTGRLSYQLLVQRREIEGICPRQKR